jgi:hypothetical protein
MAVTLFKTALLLISCAGTQTASIKPAGCELDGQRSIHHLEHSFGVVGVVEAAPGEVEKVFHLPLVGPGNAHSVTS